MSVKPYCIKGQEREPNLIDTPVGPSTVKPTSDDGHSPLAKDQLEHDEDCDEFWHTQVRHQSHFSHREPVRTFKGTESPKTRALP